MNSEKPLPIKETAMILLIGDDSSESASTVAILERAGHQCRLLASVRQAIELFATEVGDMLIAFADDALSEDLHLIPERLGDYVPTIVIGDSSQEALLDLCQQAGAEGFVSRPVNPGLLLLSVNSALRRRHLHCQELVQQEQLSSYKEQVELEREVAATVYKNVLQRNYLQTEVIKSVMPPMALFNGDLLLVERTPDNHLHVLFGDFTCHGLAASVVASPAASIFYGMSRKGFAIADIVREINVKLHSLLPINQFLTATIVALYPNSKSLGVISCGLPDHILVNGIDESYQPIESRNTPLGIYSSIEPEEQSFSVGQNHRLYLMTDGVLEAENSAGEAFGIQRVITAVCQQVQLGFKALQASLDKHTEGEVKSNEDAAFVELVCDVDNVPWQSSNPEQSNQPIQALSWKTAMEFDISALRKINPVPVMVNALMEIQGLQEHRQSIFLIVSELFANALDHGVLDLDSAIKATPEGFMRFYELKEERMQSLEQGRVRLSCVHQPTEQGGRLIIKVLDTGHGFDWQAKRQELTENIGFSGRGLKLLETLCTQLTYHGKGNRVTAVFDWSHQS